MLYFSVSLQLKSSSNNVDEKKNTQNSSNNLSKPESSQTETTRNWKKKNKMVCLHNWNPYLKTTNTVKVLNINWTISLKMIIVIIMKINEKNLIFKKKQSYDEQFKNTNVNLWIVLNNKKKIVWNEKSLHS